MYPGPPCPIGAKGNSGAAAPNAEIRNSTAAITNPRLRPMRVLTQPPEIPPMMQPINALDTTNPSSEFAALAWAGLARSAKRGSIK